MAPTVQPFPWELLDTVPKAAVRLASRVRPVVERSVALDRMADALGALVGCECSILEGRLGTARPVSAAVDGITLFFDLEGAVSSLWFEGDLVATLVGRVLQRAAPLASPQSRVDPVLAGALAALVVEIARRAGKIPISVRREPPPDQEGIQVAVTVLLDERPFRLLAWACSTEAPTSDFRSRSLRELGTLPITLPLVASVSAATAEDFASLRPGDVWVPESWSAKPENVAEASPIAVFRGQLALVGVSGERGLWAECSPDGKLVLTARIAALATDATEQPMENAHDTLAESVLDAPIVVRVEVGAVTLSARQWAELRPGDVLETGTRLNAPAILRVAGREVARGELVNVDGELGVRIREIVDAGEPR